MSPVSWPNAGTDVPYQQVISHDAKRIALAFMNKAPDSALTEKEAELVRKVAELYGITEQAAHDCLAKGALARRVKKRTGKNPAKVYSIRKKS
jgi:hypothetical protein